ncbi:MAG TPA: hypothetical protein VHO03_03630 [Ignavibacteriales bacterium]|nr:hypothetical protein [Ignavibacteriales bacterium]
MDHRTKEFTFYDKDGKEVKLSSRRYSDEVEEILENRFGAEGLQRLASSNNDGINIRFKDAKEDLPKLLTGEGLESVDWGYDFDAIVDVYLFFIQYKRNATLRQLEQYKGTIASGIETIQTILSSIPEGISPLLNSGITPNKSS